MSAAQATFYHLGVALAIGLLIGVERGWSDRDEEEGTRVAGVRTFALIGLLGGAVALAAPSFGAFFPAAGLLILGGERGRGRDANRPQSTSRSH